MFEEFEFHHLGLLQPGESALQICVDGGVGVWGAAGFTFALSGRCCRGVLLCSFCGVDLR